MYCISQFADDLSNKNYRIMFYNLENFYDCNYDSSLIYNDFTPQGRLHWTCKKYHQKLVNIYKVIKAVGEWDQQSLIGLAEVENSRVLNDLIKNTPLKNMGFDFVHYESGDSRGIDVALLFNRHQFKVINSLPIEVSDKSVADLRTRDMLYVSGVLGQDTVNVFVVHWTSRYRGLLESNHLRMIASDILAYTIDSVHRNTQKPVIIMGDFNDNPTDESVKNLLQLQSCGLVGLEHKPLYGNVTGTLKYQGNWYKFDQIIVSKSLISNREGLVADSCIYIYDADFLLEDDKKYLGSKLYRTNIGFRYNGGISDHLPIYIDINQIEF